MRHSAVRSGHRADGAAAAALALGAAALAALIWALGHRQFAAFDASIPIEAGWRLLQGQRPYTDFVMTMPPGFYLGAWAAMALWGPTWSALVAAAAVVGAAAFVAHALLLRRLLAWPAALGLAFTCQVLASAVTSYWWYNSLTTTTACLFLTAAFALARTPRSWTARAWFVATLALLLLQKPNIAAPLALLGVAFTCLRPAARLPALAALPLALAADATLLLLLDIRPADVLASYAALVASRGAPVGSFFLLFHREEALVSLPLLALGLLPLRSLAQAAPRAATIPGRARPSVSSWLIATFLQPVPTAAGAGAQLLVQLAIAAELVLAVAAHGEQPAVSSLLTLLALLLALAGTLPAAETARPVAWLGLAGFSLAAMGLISNYPDGLVLALLALLAATALAAGAGRRWQGGTAAACWCAAWALLLVLAGFTANREGALAAFGLALMFWCLVPLAAAVTAAPPGVPRATLGLALAGVLVTVLGMLTNIESTLIALPLLLVATLVPWLAARRPPAAGFEAAAGAALLALAFGLTLRYLWLALVDQTKVAGAYEALGPWRPLLGCWLAALAAAVAHANGLWSWSLPGRRLGLGTATACVLAASAATGLAAAAERWRVMYAGQYYTTGPLLRLAEPPLLAGLHASPELEQALAQIERSLPAGPERPPVFFGARLTFAYAAFGLPSPPGQPMWWDEGTSYPVPLRDELAREFQRQRYALCFFVREPYTREVDLYGLPRSLLRDLHTHYDREYLPEIVIYKRRPPGAAGPPQR